MPVFAQWVVYYDGYLPDFLVGANEEQTEQFKRIISNRSISANEYNQQMDALISQLDPSNQASNIIIFWQVFTENSLKDQS